MQKPANILPLPVDQTQCDSELFAGPTARCYERNIKRLQNSPKIRVQNKSRTVSTATAGQRHKPWEFLAAVVQLYRSSPAADNGTAYYFSYWHGWLLPSQCAQCEATCSRNKSRTQMSSEQTRIFRKQFATYITYPMDKISIWTRYLVLHFIQLH